MNNKVIELSAYTLPKIVEDKKGEWVNYGEDNNYYQFLIDRYVNSTTNNAIINNIVKLIYGDGLTSADASRKPEMWANLLSIISAEDLRKVIFDLYALGQASFQVHYSKNHKQIVKAFHLPEILLRPEKCNKDGEIEGYYYSDNWQDIKKFPPKRFSKFGTSNDEIEILRIQPYSVGLKYFSYVDYQGGLDYALLEEKISEYLINEVTNSFSPTTIINFNNGQPTDEQKDNITNSITSQLTGTTGKKLVVSFNDNETTKTTIDSVQLNNAPEHYQYLSDEARTKIMLSHNVTSPLIFGIATTTGFSANADELKNSFNLYMNLVIKPKQSLIIDALNQILNFNAVSLRLSFKTLNPFKTEIEEAQPTQLSKQVEETPLYKHLVEIGEYITDEWILVDERNVVYELENELDAQLEPKKTFLSKLVELVSTGTARPNAKSFQDKTIDGIKWKVRYQYAGNKNPERDFCKAMMSANKVYRREDLENMNSQLVNPGFEHNNEPYNVFLFAGGPRCKHYFKRLTFASAKGKDVDVTSPNAKKVGTREAEIDGYKVTNPYQVRVPKNQLPHKGFHPNNKNMPSDAK